MTVTNDHISGRGRDGIHDYPEDIERKHLRDDQLDISLDEVNNMKSRTFFVEILKHL